MKIAEVENLQSQWRELMKKPIIVDGFNTTMIQGDLQEKLNILHRLNELGEKDVEGTSIVNALEETNCLLRKISVDEPAMQPSE